MTIENIKELMDGVDIATLLPDLEMLMGYIGPLARLAVLLGPVILLFLGLYFFLRSPQEANYTLGYRCLWGMGSEQAWQFTQKLAGGVFMVLGMVLLIAMFRASSGFAELPVMDLMWEAIRCLAWQAGSILAGGLGVHLIVFMRYDFKGNRRISWAELFRK